VRETQGFGGQEGPVIWQPKGTQARNGHESSTQWTTRT